MTRVPLRPGEGAFPEDQIRIPVPPTRDQVAQDGVLRRPPDVPKRDSYRETIIRIWPDGSGGPAVDLVPSPGSPTQTPADLFGPSQQAVHIVSGVHTFDRLTTREEDAETLRALQQRLDVEKRCWRPTVATSPTRQWVEGGALLLDGTDDQVIRLAAFHGQSVILRWDEIGLAAVPTRVGVDIGDPTPVPVQLTPAATGCPLRGGADGVCKVYGGPWTSSSREAALIWQRHRALLLDAFGCDVCHGDGGEGPLGVTDLFTPSREGGWRWGAPRTRDQFGC